MANNIIFFIDTESGF